MSEVRAAARRSYPVAEASGGQEETPLIRDQGPPGEATSHRRPGAVTLGATLSPRPGEAAGRSHPEPEARGGSWEEPPTPEARAGGWEERPEEWWLCRHRRA